MRSVGIVLNAVLYFIMRSVLYLQAKRASGGNRGIKEPPLLPVGHLGEVQPEVLMGDH